MSRLMSLIILMIPQKFLNVKKNLDKFVGNRTELH